MPGDFLSYYNDELRKRGATPGAPLAASPGGLQPFTFGKTPAEENPFLGAGKWLLDIIDRPRNAVANVAKNAIDRGTAAGEAYSSGDVLGGTANTLGAILGSIPAAFQGLTSNDPDDKLSTSDLIEYGTDTIGAASNPDYIDREDNVAPVYKGTYGFVGDVLTDPLMYVPGGVLLKGAKAGVGAVDKGLTAVSKAMVGAPKGVVTAAREAVQNADEFKAANQLADDAEEAVAAASRQPKGDYVDFDFDAEDLFPAGASRPQPAPPRSGPAGPSPSTVATAMRELPAGSVAVAAETVEEVPDILKALTESVPTPAPRAQPAASAPDLPVGVADEGGAIPMGGASLQDLIASAPNKAPLQDFLAGLTKTRTSSSVPDTLNRWASENLDDAHKLVVGGSADRTMSMGQLRTLMANRSRAVQAGDKAEAVRIQRLTEPYVKQLRDEYQAAVGAAKPFDDDFTAYQAMLSRDEDSVRNALGDKLMDFLGNRVTPTKFDKLIREIKAVTDAGPDVADTLRTIDQNLSRLLSDRLGVPRLSKPSTPEEVAEYTEAAFRKNDAYEAAFSKGLTAALRDETLLKDFPYKVTKDGLLVKRTDLTGGVGKGRYVDQLNGFSQYTFMRHLTPAILEAANTMLRARGSRRTFEGLYSEQRTEAFREATLRVLDHLNRVMDETGINMSIGVGRDTSMLSTSEVYRAVMAAAEEAGRARTIDQGLFNYGTAVAPTSLTNAAAAAMRGADRDEVLAILQDAKKYGKKGLIPGQDGQLLSGLVSKGHGWGSLSYSHLAGIVEELGQGRSLAKGLIRKKEKGRTSAATGNERGKTHYYIQYSANGQNHMAEALADAIMDAKDALRVRAAENEAAFVARTGAESHKLTTEALQGIERLLADPSGIISKTASLKDWKKNIVEDAATIAAMPDSVRSSQLLTEAGMGDELVKDVETLRRAAAASEKASTSKDLERVAYDIVEATWDDVEGVVRRTGRSRVDEVIEDAEIVDDLPTVQDRPSGNPSDFNTVLDDLFEETGEAATTKVRRRDPVGDLSQDADKMVDAFGQRIQDPYSLLKHKVRSWFDQNYKAGVAHPLFSKWQNSMAMRASYLNSQLNAISSTARKAGDVDGQLIRAAFANVQRGTASMNPGTAELEKQISGVLKDFFDLDATGSLGNSFLRISSKVDAVNAMLAQKGLKFEFDAAEATIGKVFDPKMLASQWKQWDVEDPLDFMHRMNLAREELAINAGVARSFISLAKKADAYSSIPRSGFVRVTASGKSRFGAHIPDDTYIRKDLFDELQQVETTLRTSREFQGELGNFVRKVYGPTLNAWKRAITIMRPGHHVRNYIGSTSATYVRRGANEFRRSHEDAYKILMQKNDYRDVDMLAAAESNGITSLPRRGDTLLSLGKRGDIKVDEAYAYLAENGSLPSFRVSEDFLPTDGGLSKLMETLSLANTKVGKAAGGVSEFTDHFTRAQHFMQALRQDAKKFPNKSKADLMEAALKETQKYHPDASMLTPTESKLRLAIPFYTWFSKMMPALVESMVMHPGRVSLLNKASYNFAVANGIQPESIADPFPDDQLFPSFIKENPMGPQMNWGGSYVRVNPGFAHLDVMNSFGADPFRGLLGMVSPIVRVPAEVLSGGSWQTGGQISDTSDYIDQSIPFVNYLSNLTGLSTTGSVAGLLTGQGVDPQKGFQEKADGTTNKSSLDQGLSALNWLTGLGFQNLSRPNYVNYAEIEKRNAEGGK